MKMPFVNSKARLLLLRTHLVNMLPRCTGAQDEGPSGTTACHAPTEAIRVSFVGVTPSVVPIQTEKQSGPQREHDNLISTDMNLA